MTNLLNVDAISIPEDRQRTADVQDHIKELAESIARDGLINPITVTQEKKLVAGFCRLSAVKLLHSQKRPVIYDRQQVMLGYIPVLMSASEDPRVLFRIELEENLRRRDLTPTESAKALAKLHELFSENNPEWIKTDTARKLVEHEVYGDLETAKSELSRSIIVASMAEDPDVKSATSLKEAYSIARKKTEQTLLSALGLLSKSEDLPKEQRYVLHEASYRSVIHEPETFDCIIVDPPYGMGADSFGSQTMSTSHEYADDKTQFLSALQYLTAPELLRACKAAMHLFCFLDIRNFQMAREFLMKEADYYVWPTPLIWAKNVSHLPQPDMGPRRCYEAILFATRGGKTVRKHGSDVLTFTTVRDKVHAAQKPVALYEELLSWSCTEGDHVLDFCCGSGTVFEAAKNRNLLATGIERDPQMANIVRARISEWD